MNLQGQDWGEVVIRKKKPTAAQAQTEASVNAVWLIKSEAVSTGIAAFALSRFLLVQARRSGADIDTVKKCRPVDTLHMLSTLQPAH